MFSVKKSVIGCFAFMLAFSTCVSADKLTLASKPLVVAQTVPPNIMILFDTSGSMDDSASGFYKGDFDSSTTYLGSCPAENRLPTGIERSEERTRLECSRRGCNWVPYTHTWTENYYYRAAVEFDGDVTIERSLERDFDPLDDSFEWGNGGEQKCFDNNQNYQMRFDGFGVITDRTQEFDGNFMNWYFSDPDPANSGQRKAANFGWGNNYKQGVGSRNVIAIQAMRNLVGEEEDPDRLQKARVGIAGFDYESTAMIYSHLTEIETSANRSALLQAIEQMPADDWTPLGEALAALGRYFVEGHTDEVLDTGAKTGSDLKAGDLFSLEPDYANSLSAPGEGEVMEWSCQRNFIIAMTDGEPTRDDGIPTELAKWADGRDCTGENCWKNQGDFDDVAAALYDLDLRPETWSTEKNNVVTHTIGFGLDLDMLRNAADEGGGSYRSVTDSAELTSALNAIARLIREQNSTVASVAFNSGRLVNDSQIFQAKFNTAAYSGQLLAYELSSDGEISETEYWDAGARLDAMSYTSRRIFTFNSSEDVSDGVTFSWDNLSDAQKLDLAYPYTASDDEFAGHGQKILEFIRGQRSNEGGASGELRERSSRLGDIVNSTPVFVGAPEMNIPDHAQNALFGSSEEGGSYSAYASGAAASRQSVVYVGANDGMLHGFDAQTGNEVFAYIPGVLYSDESLEGLHHLADQEYDHRFYVDLTPTAGDVYIPNTTSASSAAWRTVLVGGLRAGGRGIFALDVTDPSDFSSADKADEIVLWEFTSADDADFGYSYSQPTIAMMPNGKWAAIVGNGYNSDDENAHLFILFLDGGLDGSWELGTDYIKIQAGSADSNGLSSPRVVDLNGDSVADRVYAGDLQGNMWVFDVSNADVANWGLAYGSGNALFSANDGASPAVPQPITSAPILAKNTAAPANSTAPNVLVLFGSGKFLEPLDSDGNTSLQSYYGVWDTGVHGLDRDDLAERQLITSTDGSTREVADGEEVDWENGEYGWFMDLETKTTEDGSPQSTFAGERVVSNSSIRREVLFFNTIIPDSIPCSGGGSGWLMSLDFTQGLAPAFGVFDGNDDDAINNGDIGLVGDKYTGGLPSQSGFLGDQQYTPDSKGDIGEREVYVGASGKEGRLSWEELFRHH